MSKIVGKSELLTRTRQARAQGKTVVHCHGCFDIVHPGHIRYLEFARRQGDLLVVSLTGDSQMDKGEQRPYLPEEMRAENLAALQCVDLVYINPFPTAAELIVELKPDIYIKGREYEHSHHPAFLVEQEAVAAYGGRVLFSSGDVVFSSTRLIESLESDSALESQRLALICKRHGIHRQALHDFITSFTRLNVLVIGDLIIDRYALCDATDVAGEAAMMSLRRLEPADRLFLGGAGIVASHLAALGARSHLLTTCADDEGARFAWEILAREGIDTHMIRSRSCTPERLRYLVESQKMLRVERGDSQPLDSLAEQEASQWVTDRATDIDAVIYVDHGYGTITAGLLERIRPILARGTRIETAHAGGPRGRLLNFGGVHLLCPSERELRSALNDFDRGLSSVAWTALDRTQARQMLVGLGKRGGVVFDRESQDPESPEWRGRLRSEFLPALTDHMIDPLGANAATLAATTLALAVDANLMQAAYLGQLMAALETTQLGNVPISASALTACITRRPELTWLAQDQPQRPVRFKVTAPPAISRLVPSNRNEANVPADVLSQVTSRHAH